MKTEIRSKLRVYIFMALCCDLGLFAKKLISPAANVITEFLHIPGGIATSCSLMFLIIAASMIPAFGCGTLMAIVQSVLALCFGMTGSMGLLAPVGYILPGLTVDMVLFITRKTAKDMSLSIMISSIAASITASLTANFLVFRLTGIVLILYACVSGTSGSICGLLAAQLVKRLKPVILSEKEIQ
ncbi:hypothetical protein [Butyrivibrio sp. LC3010]|uniref:hypothetical protein n=1 Tax=Butyrivibrio sp. LC3010 TaxID=1280680 RepID=UPI00047D2F9E|nr:hypothetical protein [Butyrivibrio sp. LC3010]